MPRLSLELLRGAHPPSVSAGHPVEAIRVVTQIALAAPSGWTRFHRIIVDTGAPISLLPSTIWESARYVIHGSAEVGGVVSRPECRIAAKLAEIECVLSNGVLTAAPMRMYAYLAETDSAPALLGLSGFIQRGTLHMRLEGAEAYLEFT